MANTTRTAPVAPTVKATATRPQRLRWHPVRLLYLFVVTLVVGILYSEVQALLVNPAAALDPTQLRSTFFWHLAFTYPVPFAVGSVLAVGAAVLGWRLDRRYSALQEEQRHQETVAVAEQVVQRAQAGGHLASKTIPHDLPPRAPGFVGRQHDLATLQDARRTGQTVAVVGMGGLGKSSLAAEAVHALATDVAAFPGGVTWVRCDDRVELDGLIWIEDQLLSAWGASLPAEATARAKTPEEGLELRERELGKRLGTAEGQGQPLAKLALLDNVEPGMPLSRLLDTLTPLGMAVLVTTRVEPSSQRVHLLNLEVLDQDAGVHLFAERYAGRGGEWDTDQNTPATTTIVDALGGLPLAIELAAARAARTHLPLATLAEELRAPDALARLNDPRDPSASVRYSLRKTLIALTPAQRSRFAALGLLEGHDWALPIIERMFEGVPADRNGVALAGDDLEALVAYSLVGLSTLEGRATPRVRLHPLVRELAREEWAQVPQAEQEAALDALLDGIEAWVAPRSLPSATNIQAVKPDADVIFGALQVGASRPDRVARTISIFQLWLPVVGNSRLALQLGHLVLQSARASGDRHAEATALFLIGNASGYLGRPDDQIRYLREAVAVAREIGDRTSLVRMLGALGTMLAHTEERAEAEGMFDEASAIVRESSDVSMDRATLNNLGSLATALGRTTEAADLLSRALSLARQAGNAVGEVLTRCNLGFLYEELGDFAAAQQQFAPALEIGRAFAIPDYMGVPLNGLGQVALKRGDIEAATRDFTEAQPLFEQSGMASNVLQVRGNLALAAGLQAQRQGDGVAARQAFEEALSLFEQAGGTANATDQRPYVRQLLDELQSGAA